MEYLLIFLAKIIEVTLMTLRTVFVTRGEKAYASITGFFEVTIWLKVISVVLAGLSDNPLKVLVYALGYAAGNFVGLTIEEKIGLGLSTIQIITGYDDGALLSESLRNGGRAVTVLEGQGMDNDKKSVLVIHVKRKEKDLIVKSVEKLGVKAVITISEAKKIYGGFGIRK